MELPQEFVEYTSSLFGEERWKNYLASFDGSVPVSVRLNPFKMPKEELFPETEKTPVPWCHNAFYLAERPNFTLDPLLHAGVYYVQEAGSMFLDEVLRQLKEGSLLDGVTTSLPLWERQGGGSCLDLCAAPGGKSTLLRAALPDDCVLYSNEPDRRRANILMENIQKQGHPNVIVTNNYAIDYQRTGMTCDLIVCDVPCSGEGMFRKDYGAIDEWSLQNVMKCAALQRSIIEDIWPCLNEGGVMVYSTCTFNLHEDEENVKWICETLGAELIPIETKDEWNITGSLLKGWDKPVYRFIPGTTKGEGLFMAVLKKTPQPPKGVFVDSNNPSKASLQQKKVSKKLPLGGMGGLLRILSDGHPVGTQKGKNIIPAHAEALLINLPKDKYPFAELSKEDALKYLHHEAIVLDADVPKGFVVVTYQGHPLGFVKNIGNRANNLYPQEWKIRNL
jgi:16S rRNA C967 or C1407 C5-methylase (RsmB/RsmF family)/NOL1/NOP2/fmu family ribosome biogenesis protein